MGIYRCAQQRRRQRCAGVGWSEGPTWDMKLRAQVVEQKRLEKTPKRSKITNACGREREGCATKLISPTRCELMMARRP